MIEAVGRRGFIGGALALVAAPVIVRAASLMPVNASLVPGNRYLDINEITRESARLFQNSNEFIKKLDAKYEREAVLARDFYEGEQWGDEQVGTMMRLRLPNDYVYNKERRSLDRIAPPIDKLALAVAAPVLVAKALEQPMTRRFWGMRK